MLFLYSLFSPHRNMILKFHRSSWRFQWFIVLLSCRVSYFPITLSVGVIPLRDFSSGFLSFKFATDRLHHGRVIDSKIDVSNLRQISQFQIWDPGISILEIGDGGLKSRLDHNNRRCLIFYLTWAMGVRNPWRCSFDSERPFYFLCADVGEDKNEEVAMFTNGRNFGWKYYEGTLPFNPSSSSDISNSTTKITNPIMCVYLCWKQPITSEVGDFLFLALVFMDDAMRMRIRRLNQQHVWVYGTIKNFFISFFERVPKSMVLRCNGWIADLAFRKRKRWYIDKKQMFPKLESHTRLTDRTRATKSIFRIAALNLLCFFVTKIFVCTYILMFIIITFGSY